ncbi:MAG TPA: hypothetical protein EYH42_06940 [Sulfurovum sp.]|nr:hypothetical protein [Sulfurovum sp.]
MSWYRLIITLFVLLSVSTSTIHAKKLMSIAEDELIIRGLLFDEYKAYKNSYKVYKKLFDLTGEEIFLFKEATSSLLSREYIIESISRLKAWDKIHPDRLEVRRLLIPLYLTSRQVEHAKKEAEYLLEQSSELIDLDLASNSFLYAGEFKRALNLLNKIYETVPNEDVLLKITEVMDEFTGERKKAIQLLETHRRMNISSKDVYIKLLILYQKEKDIDGVLETYKALYEQEKNEHYLSKVIDAYVYKRDLDGAIAFLEKYKNKTVLLYELYKAKKYFSKALGLVDTLYEQDKNAKWLAEKGILIFEKAEDKNDKNMIKEALSHFEKAFTLGNDDSLYLNYYGYTLIDKEVDVEKGIQILKDALVQQPNNTYYLDSIAWGYYKQGECAKAYAFMKRVVDEEGLNEPEIIEHWNAIKQCK